MKRLLSWLLVVPVTALSVTVGHSLSYRLAFPDPHEREHALAAGGHGYLEHAPLVLAVCGAFALLALGARTVAAFRGRGATPSLAWPVAAVPPLAFVIQEVGERVLHSGELHWTNALALRLAVGLLVQVPFALLAVLVARVLESLADRLGAALGAPPRPRLSLVLPSPAPAVVPPRPRGLALGYAGRGPPSSRAS